MIEYIVNDFNTRCSNASFLAKSSKRVLAVRNNVLRITDNNGIIVADCRRSKEAIEGDTYCITISDSHFHCSCIAFSTSKRDEFGHKIPCKHLIFVAASVAVHIARGGK
jgi:hypothetical protein